MTSGTVTSDSGTGSGRVGRAEERASVAVIDRERSSESSSTNLPPSNSLNQGSYNGGVGSGRGTNDTAERVVIETIADGLVGSTRQGVAGLESSVLCGRTSSLGDSDGGSSRAVRSRSHVLVLSSESIKVVRGIDTGDAE